MNKNNVWFTSDNHFGHAKIIEYCNRPFKTVDHMDSVMIERWNSVVLPDDTIYHLGDFSMGDTAKYLQQLNGKKHLIKGNHDKQVNFKYWESVSDYKEIYLEKQFVVMCHYAFLTWNKSHYGSIDLHGHSHNTLPGDRQRLDVGVDCWDFTPVNIDDIKRRLNTFPERVKPDYHGNI